MPLTDSELRLYTQGMAMLPSPDAFEASTKRERDFLLFKSDAGPGANLSAAYKAYRQFWDNKSELRFAEDAHNKLWFYIANASADSINARGRGTFEILDRVLRLHIKKHTFTPQEANTRVAEWQLAIQRNRINSAIFLGNIKLKFGYMSLLPSVFDVGLSGLHVGHVNIEALKSDVINTLKYPSEVAGVTALGVGSAATASGLITVSSYVEMLYGIWTFIKEKVTKFFESMFNRLKAADISALQPIVSAVCSAVYLFVKAATETLDIVKSGFKATTAAVNAALGVLRKQALEAAHLKVGIFHEYWRIIDDSLQYGETLDVMRSAKDFMVGVTEMLVTLLGSAFGGAGALVKLIVSAVDLTFKLASGAIQQYYIDKALGVAQVMAKKIHTQLGEQQTVETFAAMPFNEAMSVSEVVQAQNRAALAIQNELSAQDFSETAKFTSKAVRTMGLQKEAADAARAVVARNADLIRKFNPDAYSVDQFMRDTNKCYTIYLQTMCSASPYLAACIVNSGVMSDYRTVTMANHYESSYNDTAAQEYLRQSGVTARSLISRSGFDCSPAPVIPSFGNIVTDWQNWVAAAQLNQNPNMLTFSS